MNRLKKAAPIKPALQPALKKILYAVSLVLWLTGAVWLYLSQGHPAGALLLRIHGAFAMGFLILFGVLIADHVPVGWRQKDQRPSGLSVMTSCVLLILTGWGLYYFAGEQLRHWTSRIHSILGLLLPLIIFLHVRSGRRSDTTATR